MKKVFKWLGIIVLSIIVLVFLGIGYVLNFKPDIDAPDITVEVTPDKVARGKYLANSICVCMDCHSTRDWSLFAAPIIDGTFGAGGERFDRTMGFPGVFYSKNITPHGIGNWTDGEVYRAITSGIDKNGDPLFPVMPFHNYGHMATEDVHAIIAYLRSLPSVESDVPAKELDPPLNIILRLTPEAPQPESIPEKTDQVAYGKYLTNAAACIECHSPADEKGMIKRDSAFAGGRLFSMPFGELRSSNITPHNTGLGMWNADMFVAKFKQYQDSTYQSPKLDMMNGDFNSIMPWMMYSTMTEEDLRAIYAYLQTVTPIEHEVTKMKLNK